MKTECPNGNCRKWVNVEETTQGIILYEISPLVKVHPRSHWEKHLDIIKERLNEE